MPEILLSVNQLSKYFKIYPNPWDRAREWISLRRKNYHQKFWALQDISFEISKGQFFGIIGQNGSGKSTLLKIVTGILAASSGTITLKGRVLSLLELGRDFNFELTGRQNVIYSAELLGFEPDYVKNRLIDIQDFAELGEFFDRPMKLYSSGMKSRLAFSLFAFLECDLLILDEVLAVGDIFFQQKCFARLEQLIAQQTTIVLVTHNLATVQQYCDRVILLHQGRQIFQGDPKLGIIEYYKLRHQQPQHQDPETPIASQDTTSLQPDSSNISWPDDAVFTDFNPPTETDYPLVRYALCDRAGNATAVFLTGETVYIHLEFRVNSAIAVPIVGINLTNKFNVRVYGKSSMQGAITAPNTVSAGSTIRFTHSVELALQAHQYVLGVSLTTLPISIYQLIGSIPLPEITSQIQILAVYEQLASIIVRRDLTDIKNAHYGLCHLPGSMQLMVGNAHPTEDD